METYGLYCKNFPVGKTFQITIQKEYKTIPISKAIHFSKVFQEILEQKICTERQVVLPLLQLTRSLVRFQI